MFISFCLSNLVQRDSIYNDQITSLDEFTKKTSYDATRSHNQTRILILTLRKSGSTFFAEIFNQNNDSLFLFEPLHSYFFMKSRIKEMSAQKRVSTNLTIPEPQRPLLFDQKLLQAIFTCDYSSLPNRIHLQDLCFDHGKVRSSALFCRNRRYHGINDPLELNSICRRYSSVSVKTIRVSDIMDLKDVIISSNVKIIHLVRDPRGVLNSRIRAYKWHLDNGKYKPGSMPGVNDIKDICSHMEKHFMYWHDTPKWLKGRFKLVRYEDMAEQPLKVSREVYSFLQMKLPTRVLKWLKENTHAKENDGITTRNSKATAQKWQTELDRELIDTIQRECKKAMELYGYENV